MARWFAIRTFAEAQAYLGHPILGVRLRECVAALQDLSVADAPAVFGDIDAMKLRSSLTLFKRAGADDMFAAAIDRWFAGQEDLRTIQSLQSAIPDRRCQCFRAIDGRREPAGFPLVSSEDATTDRRHKEKIDGLQRRV